MDTDTLKTLMYISTNSEHTRLKRFHRVENYLLCLILQTFRLTGQFLNLMNKFKIMKRSGKRSDSSVTLGKESIDLGAKFLKSFKNSNSPLHNLLSLFQTGAKISRGFVVSSHTCHELLRNRPRPLIHFLHLRVHGNIPTSITNQFIFEKTDLI